MTDFTKIKEIAPSILESFKEVYPELVPSKNEMVMESFEAGFSFFPPLLETTRKMNPELTEEQVLDFCVRRCLHAMLMQFKPDLQSGPLDFEDRDLLDKNISVEDWYEDYQNNPESVTVMPYEDLTGEFRDIANRFYYNKKQFDPMMRNSWFFFKNNKIIMIFSYSNLGDGDNDVMIMCEPDSHTSETMSKVENLDQFVTYIDNYNEEKGTN